MPPKITVAAIQTADLKHSKPDNLIDALARVEDVAELRPDFVCLGELFTTRYFPALEGDFTHLAESIPGQTTQALAWAAKHINANIVAGLYEHDPAEGRYYNSAVLISRSGEIISKYRKVHLPHLKFGNIQSREPDYFSPGNLGFPVSEVEGVKVGIMVCYDRSFPESWRSLALGGADLVFVPTAAPGWRVEHWQKELEVAALENNVFAVATNRGGYEGESLFFGRSCIVDPFGHTVAAAPSEEACTVTATLNWAVLQEARERLPVFGDRRPEAYQL